MIGRNHSLLRTAAATACLLVVAMLGNLAWPANAAELGLQDGGSDAIGAAVSIDEAGPRNPSCSVSATSPAAMSDGPGAPTKYRGHAWASCTGNGWANIELYSLIQYSPGSPNNWQTLTETQRNAFGERFVEAWPEMPRGRVGYLRTRGVARFTFGHPVQQHEVRNGCAKPGPYTITCVVWSSPPSHTV